METDVPAALLGLERVLLDRTEARAQGSRDRAGFAVRHRLRRDDHRDAERRPVFIGSGRVPPRERADQRPRLDQAEGQFLPRRPHDHGRLRARDARHLQPVRAAQRRASGRSRASTISRTRSRPSLSYSNAFTNDAADGAAAFGYDVDSFYVQDEWQATPDFKIQAGMRMDIFSGSDKPLLNANFAGRYGFNNQETLDGRDLFMPRIGFNWQWTPRHDGLRRLGPVRRRHAERLDLEQLLERRRDRRATRRQPGHRHQPDPRPTRSSAVDGFNIPQEVLDFNATPARRRAGQRDRSGLRDPVAVPLEPRRQAHAALGHRDDRGPHLFARQGRGPVAGHPPAAGRHGAGRPPDLRPARRRPRRARDDPGLPADEHERGRGHGVLDRREQDLAHRCGPLRRLPRLRLPGREGRQSGHELDGVLELGQRRRLRPERPGTRDLELRDRAPVQRHVRLAQGVFRRLRDAASRLSPSAARAAPYSYTFGAGTPQGLGRPAPGLAPAPASSTCRTATSSSRRRARRADVSATSRAAPTTDGFSSANAAAAAVRRRHGRSTSSSRDSSSWRGRIMPRNSHRSPWVTILDLRIAQELPIFRRMRGIVTFDIENFANLLNNDWGQLRQVSFPYVAPVVDVDRISDDRLPERRGELLRLSAALGPDGAGQAVQDDFLAAVGVAHAARASASSSERTAQRRPRLLALQTEQRAGMRTQCADAVLMIRPARFGANPETAESNRFQQAGAAAGDAAGAALREFDGPGRALRRAASKSTSPQTRPSRRSPTPASRTTG